MTACREYRFNRTVDGHAHLWRDGERTYIHRWVMEQMLGRKLRPDEVVRHTCDNPPCYLYEHLVLGTQAENLADMMSKGRERHPRSMGKLSERDVVQIKNLLREGKTQVELGRVYGVSNVAISLIQRGKIAGHVTRRFV